MGQRLRRHAERVASGQTPLLHRGRREGGKSDHVAHRIAKAQTLALSANKPVALLLCRDLMWEEA